jgi:hypothetical protein
MSSNWPEGIDFLDDITRNLSERDWAISRIHDWINASDTVPAFLIRGNPGSGKSTLLAQFLASLADIAQARNQPAPRVIATVLRHPAYQQPFDATRFLTDIVKGLADFAPAIVVPQFAVDSPPQINVSQNIGQAEKVTGVVFELGISSLSGLLALAEQRVRATPKTERALFVIDALDQAEDEGADEFLRTVAAMVRAAEGTGVRILCASRTRIPIWLDPPKRLELDLVEDADDLDSELGEYLHKRFAFMKTAERGRVVDALLNGAQGNWLWASTNASALENEIATSKTVPSQISLSEGLSGLYSDEWRRIRRKISHHTTESQLKRVLGVVACSFTGSLGVTEIRWSTGIDPGDIKDLVHECEPFLAFDHSNKVRTFHPDFSRWLFQTDEVGLSEPSEHLRLARGLTSFGKATRWRQGAESYATQWVLNHWSSVLILDPFRPDAEILEEELSSIIADPDWGERAGSSIETIAQLGLVAPRIQFPGYRFPLLVGLRALQASPAVDRYTFCRVLQRLRDDEIDQLFLAEEGRRKWLEEHLPDFSSIISFALWGGLLAQRFHVTQTDGGVMVSLRASAILDALTSSPGRIGPEGQLASQIGADVSPQDRPALLDGLHALLARNPADWVMTAKVNRTLGQVHRQNSEEHSSGPLADELELAAAAYARAWQALPPGHDDRLTFAIDLSNTLRELPERSAEQLDLLIAAQTEIRDLRHSTQDPGWPGSADLLGDAYRERAQAKADADGEARIADLTQALAGYTQAWQAVPSGHEDRLTFAIDLANTLMDLPERSAAQLDLLITAQTEIRDLRRATEDPVWPRSADLLGDAYRARAYTQTDPEARAADLTQALAAYTQAWEAIPPGHDDRLTFAIDLSNVLRDLPERSAAQLSLLITVQSAIRDLRQSADDPGWPISANLLGQAYRAYAETRADTETDARTADLTQAVAAHTQAWEAVPAGHDDRLTFAIDLANTLMELPNRSAEQLGLLITVQGEIRDLRRGTEDPGWPISANLLGDAYRERAQTQTDPEARTADLTQALAAYTEAWQAVPPGHDDRLILAIDVADTLRDLPERSAEQLDLLIAVQGEIRDLRHGFENPGWPRSANLLGDAYRGRARAQADADARTADLTQALAAYTEAWQAVPPGHEDRLMFAIDLANTLMDLPERSGEQLDLLIAAQTEIRDLRQDAQDPGWPGSADLLGDAYRARAQTKADTDSEARTADLTQAIAAYAQAWQAVPPGHDDQLTFAIDLANTLMELPELSAEQLELLIALGTGIRDRQRNVEDPAWPRSANLLGDTYRSRAETQTDAGARAVDLLQALAAYAQAWQALPPGHDDRLTFAIDVADTLRDLPERSAAQLDLLIAAQGEIRDLRQSAEDPGWPRSADLLGDAYRERAQAKADTDSDARTADLLQALAAYTQAWQAVPPGHDDRLMLAIDLANTLMELPKRSAEQLDLLVTAQSEIRDLRSAEDPERPVAANLLGAAYQERAETRTDTDARAADLTQALAAYTEAWQALPPDHEKRLRYAIDLANALVIRAAIQPADTMDGRAVIDQALDLVSSAITGRRLDDLTELRGLLPVLSVQLVRQQWLRI